MGLVSLQKHNWNYQNRFDIRQSCECYCENKETFSFVGVYGPTQVRALADENEEITFIEELQSTIEKQPKNTTIIFSSDFNTKLENKKNGNRQLWKRKTKQHGAFLYKLLSTKNIIATNTCFK